jgi:hypothetical protein
MDIGIRQYQPIQTHDQMLNTINGRVANLLHTDQGLACFSQLSSLAKNNFDMVLSSSKKTPSNIQLD